MENVTFFTLLPESIEGNRLEADREFTMYVTIAFAFAANHNLNIKSVCGISTFENSSLEKYFSKLTKRSTVLIISPALVGNPKILNSFIRKDVTFRVVEGDYLVKPKLLKKLWLEQAKKAKTNFPNAVDYLIKTEVLTAEGKVNLV